LLLFLLYCTQLLAIVITGGQLW